MKKLLLAATVLAMVFTTGCKKEEPVDVRDAAVGTYNGTFTAYALQNNELKTIDGISTPVTVNGSIAKDASNSGSIRIDIDGDIFYGSKISAVSNGFVFDIEDLTIDMGNTCHAEGYNAIVVGTSKYNGAYFSTDKKVSFGVKIAVSEIYAGDTATLAALSTYGVTYMVVVFTLNKR